MTYNKEEKQMTSERALWELMHNAIKTYNKDDIFRLRAIKRDLEILYMLKKNMMKLKKFQKIDIENL